ncbi:MAG: hypothetical protein LQ346_004283, partial [Caloplaca aetnensis]
MLEPSTGSTIDTTAHAAGPRILHVGQSSLTFTHALGSDNDDATYLYMLDNIHAKLKAAPEVTIKSATTSITIGTIMGYALTKTMDIT